MAEDRRGTGPPAPDLEPGQLEEEAAANRRVRWALAVFLAAGLALIAAGFALSLATGQLTAQRVRLEALFSAPALGDRLGALGILVLALSPAAAVLVILGRAARQRDRRFALVTVSVLVVLMAAVAAGGGL